MARRRTQEHPHVERAAAAPEPARPTAARVGRRAFLFQRFHPPPLTPLAQDLPPPAALGSLADGTRELGFRLALPCVTDVVREWRDDAAAGGEAPRVASSSAGALVPRATRERGWRTTSAGCAFA
jgi:hypothetical protein